MHGEAEWKLSQGVTEDGAAAAVGSGFAVDKFDMEMTTLIQEEWRKKREQRIR
jgi:hypothetical protein